MKTESKYAKKLLGTIKLLYTPLSIGFILYFAYMNRLLLEKMFDLADIVFIAIASAIWAISHLMAPVISKIIFAGLGYKIQLAQLISIHISRLPARYLPGGIWHTVGRYSDYIELGTSKKHLTALALIETFFPCLITLLLGGSLLWYSGGDNLITTIEGGIAITSFLILLVAPFLLKYILPDLETRSLIIKYLSLTIFSAIFWIVASISFLFYFFSIAEEISNMPFLKVIATYIFSWGIGYIAVFAPQGLGVFEVIAGKLLEMPMTLGGAVSFIAGFRIVVLIADVICWLSYRVFFRRTSKNNDHILDKP